MKASGEIKVRKTLQDFAKLVAEKQPNNMALKNLIEILQDDTEFKKLEKFILDSITNETPISKAPVMMLKKLVSHIHKLSGGEASDNPLKKPPYNTKEFEDFYNDLAVLKNYSFVYNEDERFLAYNNKNKVNLDKLQDLEDNFRKSRLVPKMVLSSVATIVLVTVATGILAGLSSPVILGSAAVFITKYLAVTMGVAKGFAVVSGVLAAFGLGALGYKSLRILSDNEIKFYKSKSEIKDLKDDIISDVYNEKRNIFKGSFLRDSILKSSFENVVVQAAAYLVSEIQDKKQQKDFINLIKEIYPKIEFVDHTKTKSKKIVTQEEVAQVDFALSNWKAIYVDSDPDIKKLFDKIPSEYKKVFDISRYENMPAGVAKLILSVDLKKFEGAFFSEVVVNINDSRDKNLHRSILDIRALITIIEGKSPNLSI
ncbi:MAG: hypothetical protein J0G32_04725 [Alphaproteobacteria bacterium]|nr:hypothetical protein [Alphaproteobacteria bacterium]OJV15067.1 MAG: hypothetical protein BGO27_06480 [Alphaproteobacteria bacterium 33-17]